MGAELEVDNGLGDAVSSVAEPGRYFGDAASRIHTTKVPLIFPHNVLPA